MVMVRPEPARSVIAPDASPLTIGILNNGDVGRSGAVTSTTTVATAVPETLARTRSVVSAPRAESAPIHHVFERPVGLLELGFALVVGQRIDSGEADTLGIAEEVFVPAQTVQKGKGVG